MKELKELTETQYDILSKMNNEYCYSFRHFNDLNLTKKELSREFKILRETGLVYFTNGLMNEDGKVDGSGYGLDKTDEVYKLIDDWEEKNLPTWEEAMRKVQQ